MSTRGSELQTRPLAVSTIGTSATSARHFFQRLETAGVRRVLDVRLNNTSQLAGFAKRDDLAWFLEQRGIGYVHRPDLAPTDTLLKDLQKKRIDWGIYEDRFLDLMADRKIEDRIEPGDLLCGCLLCSEPSHEECHRRLICSYLDSRWDIPLDVSHL